ncbi:MAG: hypothetical protein D6740_04045 [Alphaproteobacteria bacterium]|nr:MAG: hypothetical protein D6740_04045 [Alphaproteobacteria bacterium]
MMVVFVGGLAVAVTLALARPASDLARELHLCRQMTILGRGAEWHSAWGKLVRLSQTALTPEQAIRLIYPNYNPRLPPPLRFRPPPAPHNIDVLRAAASRTLRKIRLRLHNGNGETLVATCRFIRLNGRTQWLDPADRSQSLFAAAFGQLGESMDACCIYQDHRVR